MSKIKKNNQASSSATPLVRLGASRSECVSLITEIRSFLSESGKTSPDFVEPGKISVALVGQYNAGKSTLVNALFGEDRAVTGDGPTTKVRQIYDWKDYHIVDLPGSDARLDEQEEARAAILDVQMVLYVVSAQSGLDRDTFWIDLVRLTKQKIPFLVVVNDKAPHQTFEAEEAYRTEIVSNFQKKRSTRDDVQLPGGSVFWVNAKRAEKGRKEGKTTLVENSGILSLETAILDLLSRNDGLLREIGNLRHFDRILDDLYKSISVHLSSSDSHVVSMLIERVDNARTLLTSRAEGIAEENTTPLADLVSTKLSQGVIGGKETHGDLATEITSITEAQFESAVRSFAARAKPILAHLCATLDGSSVEWQEINSKFKTNIGAVPGKEDQPTDWSAALRRTIGAGTLAKQLAGQFGEEAIKAGGKELLKDSAEAGGAAVAKGGVTVAEEGAKSAARHGAEAAGNGIKRFIGPAVVVAVAAWEVWAGYKKEAKEARLIRLALDEATSKAALLSIQFKQEFLARICGNISSALDPLADKLRVQLSKSAAQQKKLEMNLSKISDFRARLDKGLSQLSAGAHE